MQTLCKLLLIKNLIIKFVAKDISNKKSNFRKESFVSIMSIVINENALKTLDLASLVYGLPSNKCSWSTSLF